MDVLNRKLGSVVATIVLLGMSAVAFAANVQGHEFERAGLMSQAGTAHAIDASEGRLRFMLEPSEDAVAPSALFSVYQGSARQGTFALDPEWRSLDVPLASGGRYVMVVHQAIDAGIAVLRDDGKDAPLKPLELRRDTVALVAEADTDLARQVAVRLPAGVVDLGVALQGSAQGLTVNALDDGGESVLSIAAPDVAHATPAALVGDLRAARLAPGMVTFRVQADDFNGTLDAVVSVLPSVQDPAPRPIAPRERPERPERPFPPIGGNHTGNQSVAEPSEEGTIVAELVADTPIAFDVAEGVETIVLVGRTSCTAVALFGPDDTVLFADTLSRRDGTAWGDDGLVAIEVPIEGPGEYVAYLSGDDEGALVFLPGVLVDASSRTLEIGTVELGLEEDMSLLGSSSAEGEATIDGGLLGFVFRSGTVDAWRDVRLTGPNGTDMSSWSVASAGLFEFVSVGGHLGVGPAGTYTIETDAMASSGGEHVAVFSHYIR